MKITLFTLILCTHINILPISKCVKAEVIRIATIASQGTIKSIVGP